MLAADAYMQLRIYGLAQLNGHFHQFAHAVSVNLRERIVLKDLAVIVSV